MIRSCENNTLRFRRKGISKKEKMDFRKTHAVMRNMQLSEPYKIFSRNTYSIHVEHFIDKVLEQRDFPLNM